MSSFNSMKNQIRGSIDYANRFKNVLAAYSCICIITSVNEKDFTVDVTVPSMGSKLFGVQIATNITGGKASMHMLPSKDQKGIILISSQHAPMLIAIVPATKQKDKSYVLENEAMIGTSHSFFKAGNDSSALIKTPSAMIGLSDNKLAEYSPEISMNSDGCLVEYLINTVTGNSFCRESYFFRNKKYVPIKKTELFDGNDISKEAEESVLTDNDALLSKLSELISVIDSFNAGVELGSNEVISDLADLKEQLSRYFICQSKDAMIVEKGESYYNNDNNLLYSVRTEKDGKTTLHFSIPK